MHKFDGTLNNSGTSAPGLPAEAVYDGIAFKLRQLYCNLESEGIPDSLLQLLGKLDAAERAQVSDEQSEGAVNG